MNEEMTRKQKLDYMLSHVGDIIHVLSFSVANHSLNTLEYYEKLIKETAVQLEEIETVTRELMIEE